MIYYDAVRGRNVAFSEIDGMSDWAFQVVRDRNSISVINGGTLHRYNKRTYSAAVDDVEFREALAEGATNSCVFASAVWDDLSQLSAAPQGSIAGAILRNLAYAPEERRIDTLLLDNVRRRLQGIVELIRGELETTAAALGIEVWRHRMVNLYLAPLARVGSIRLTQSADGPRPCASGPGRATGNRFGLARSVQD